MVCSVRATLCVHAWVLSCGNRPACGSCGNRPASGFDGLCHVSFLIFLCPFSMIILVSWKLRCEDFKLVFVLLQVLELYQKPDG